MSELEQVWRGRLGGLQKSWLTIAEGCEVLGVSVYRWRKLLAVTRSSKVQSPTVRF
ncbi:MAG: hypothetical protein ACKOEO_05130 [Planctomycetaceae bacterium]